MAQIELGTVKSALRSVPLLILEGSGTRLKKVGRTARLHRLAGVMPDRTVALPEGYLLFVSPCWAERTSTTFAPGGIYS